MGSFFPSLTLSCRSFKSRLEAPLWRHDIGAILARPFPSYPLNLPLTSQKKGNSTAQHDLSLKRPSCVCERATGKRFTVVALLSLHRPVGTRLGHRRGLDLRRRLLRPHRRCWSNRASHHRTESWPRGHSGHARDANEVGQRLPGSAQRQGRPGMRSVAELCKIPLRVTIDHWLPHRGSTRNRESPRVSPQPAMLAYPDTTRRVRVSC